MYADLVGSGLPLENMLSLVGYIEQSHFSTLFGWSSMHDLCISQVPATYPYNGPYLRISPQRGGTVEFRYIDTPIKEKQWSRIVTGNAAFERLVSFANQLHWFTSTVSPNMRFNPDGVARVL
jgi:hypothetical protein